MVFAAFIFINRRPTLGTAVEPVHNIGHAVSDFDYR